jgi:hypothetical protein
MVLPSFAPVPPIVFPLEIWIVTPALPFGMSKALVGSRPMRLAWTSVPLTAFMMRTPTVPFPEIAFVSPTPPIRFPVAPPAQSRITPSNTFGRASVPA